MEGLRLVRNDAPVRFLLDRDLMPLARHLRRIGFDTALASDDPVPTVAALHDRAREEFRILILAPSRPSGAPRDAADALETRRLRSTEPSEQLLEILKNEPALRAAALGGAGAFLRCPECNGDLHSISRELAYERLPRETADAHEKFWCCARCEKVSWDGAHAERQRRWLHELLADESPS